MDEWHDLMVVQRMFYPETSLFEEGCVLAQDESEPQFRNLGKEEGFNQSLVKKHSVHIDQWDEQFC